MPRDEQVEGVLLDPSQGEIGRRVAGDAGLRAVLDHAAQRVYEVVGETFDDFRPVALGAVDPAGLESAVAHEGHHFEAVRALVRRPVPAPRRLVGEPEQFRTRYDLIELAEIVEQQLGRWARWRAVRGRPDRVTRSGERRSSGPGRVLDEALP